MRYRICRLPGAALILIKWRPRPGLLSLRPGWPGCAACRVACRHTGRGTAGLPACRQQGQGFGTPAIQRRRVSERVWSTGLANQQRPPRRIRGSERVTLRRAPRVTANAPAFPGRMHELATTHDPQQPVRRVRHPGRPGFPVVDRAFGDPQKLRSGGDRQVAAGIRRVFRADSGPLIVPLAFRIMHSCCRRSWGLRKAAGPIVKRDLVPRQFFPFQGK